MALAARSRTRRDESQSPCLSAHSFQEERDLLISERARIENIETEYARNTKERLAGTLIEEEREETSFRARRNYRIRAPPIIGERSSVESSRLSAGEGEMTGALQRGMCARKCCCIFRVRDKSRRVTRECKNFRCPGALDTKATMPSTSARVGIVSNTLQERRTFRGPRERRRCTVTSLCLCR